MLGQGDPAGIRMGERGLGPGWHFYTRTSHDSLPDHRILGLLQKHGEISKLVVVPPQIWTADSRLAHAPCDTSPRQDLRRDDNDLQLRLCDDLRG